MKTLRLFLFILLASCNPVEQPQTLDATQGTEIPSTAQIISPKTETTSINGQTIGENEEKYTQLRLDMVENTITNRGISNPDVLRAMQNVPRHLFVPADFIPFAYEDHPLPIGYGQTISQPYIVALMTELLALKEGEKVLEIGTGSGYQAAVLAELGYVEVYSIEIVPELAERAVSNQKKAGYGQISVMQGDGYYGWEEHMPFDAIIVTAAPDHVPLPLVQQLRDGGRMVIPIGPPGGYQTLWQFTKKGEELIALNMGGVTFVPFTGEGISSPDP